MPTLERSEILILCKHNIPISEIRPLPTPRTLPHPIGLAADCGVKLPPEFFNSLPAELLTAFSGETVSSSDVY
ncbi:MAG: type II toxin-antitoxin system Phd/YefM family antitoxin [Candidatus Competibacteraceae bacterium]|nr:type II toxin-antitoxin system Phd/YefM family antitoxin [Candidatus Competibacteraceae bacterium]